MNITVAHSPDSDDAFMFYGLAAGKVQTDGLTVTHVLADIETLNRAAFEGRHEVTAISFHAYAYLADRYLLLPHGASMGDGYGPVVVARRDAFESGAPTSRGGAAIKGRTIAIPGELTTAYLVLRLFEPEFTTRVMPFDRILEAVRDREAEAGLLIHEGQLTFQDEQLVSLVDLGVWWAEHTGGLPLPLGANAIRRDLGPEIIRTVSRILKESIVYALEHRDEALDYALQFGRGLDRGRADRFVSMYVNRLTIEYGSRGRAAVERLYTEAGERALIPPVAVEYAA
jgi:1,4-dihydroxy-6-naphthoate synthase